MLNAQDIYGTRYELVAYTFYLKQRALRSPNADNQPRQTTQL